MKKFKSYGEYANEEKRTKKEHKDFRKMRRNPSKKQWQGI